MHGNTHTVKIYKKHIVYNSNISIKPRRGQKIDRRKERSVKRQRQNYFLIDGESNV